MQTYTGVRFDFVDTTVDMIRLSDLAHQLARCCRYANAGPHYTVAQHCVLVAGMLPPEKRLRGLLHDASEAYTKDVITPMKLLLGDVFADIEERIERCIAERFEIEWPITDQEIHEADMRIRDSELDLVHGDTRLPDWEEHIIKQKRKMSMTAWPFELAKQHYHQHVRGALVDKALE